MPTNPTKNYYYCCSKRVNILKNSCFCILLNDNSEYIKPITKNEYENQLNLFKTSLTNDLIEIFKPADFGIKFEHILINILDNKSQYIIKQNQLKSKLSKIISYWNMINIVIHC